MIDRLWANPTFRAFVIIGLALHICDMLFGPPAFLVWLVRG
jgi:hypothetical protein